VTPMIWLTICSYKIRLEKLAKWAGLDVFQMVNEKLNKVIDTRPIFMPLFEADQLGPFSFSIFERLFLRKVDVEETPKVGR
jgi:hypothetical protein